MHGRFLVRAWFFLLALVIPTSAAYATIRLHNDLGGYVGYYQQQFRRAAARGERVIISGRCGSSCTLGLKYRNVCAMPGTIFGFHAARMSLHNYHMNKRGTRVLESAVPPGFRLHPLSTRHMQFIRASQLPARYLCH